MSTFLCISDSHGKHNYIPKDWLPKADCIIHSGDVSNIGRENEVEDFLEWFSKLPYSHHVFCAGNHDKIFDLQPSIAKEILAKYHNITYLEDSFVIIDGIKIYGSPITPSFGYGWAFNKNRGEQIKKHWTAISDDTSVLITHGPPYGILDIVPSGEHAGCQDLLNRISELKQLKLSIHGHLHGGYGVYKTATENNLIIANASVLNDNYVMTNKPLLFEIKEGKTKNISY